MFRFSTLLTIILTLLFCVPVLAQDKEDGEEKEKAEKKKPTVTAKEKPIVVYEKFTGIVQSTETGETKADIKSWSDLEIKKIVDEGTTVKTGDEIIWFETEKLDLAIRDAEFALEGAKLDHKEAEIAAAQAEVEYNLDNDLNTREMEQAREDYEYYQQVSRAERLKDLEYQLKSSNYGVEYAKEELDQLMKMYNEDEMTEELSLIHI